MQYCLSCGNQIAGTRFCVVCGEPADALDSATAATSANAPKPAGDVDETRLVAAPSMNDTTLAPALGPVAPAPEEGGRRRRSFAKTVVPVGAGLAAGLVLMGGVAAWGLPSVLSSSRSPQPQATPMVVDAAGTASAATHAATPSPAAPTVTVTPPAPTITVAPPAPTVTVTATAPAPSSSNAYPAMTETIRAYLGLVDTHEISAACALTSSNFTPCQPANYSEFVNGTWSTSISDITVAPLSSTSAKVTYRSYQSAADSPDHSGLTCTDWTVRFDIVTSESGPFIEKVANPAYPGPAYRAC